MWFARLFGGRPEEGEDEQPTATPVVRPATSGALSRPPAQPPVKLQSRKPSAKGFDPYNSGSFERRNAWERIGRR